MRFKVERTSRYSDDEAPCPGAERGEIARWDVRTCKSPEEFEALGLGDWFGNGTQHGYVHGPRGGIHGIKRRLDTTTAWFVEVDSLEGLMAFFGEHGDLVVTTASEDRETPTIEIYDGYRE